MLRISILLLGSALAFGCQPAQETNNTQTQTAQSHSQTESEAAAAEAARRPSEPTVVSQKVEELEAQSTNRHSYNLEETTNDGVCYTGEKIYDTEEDYCEGLKDHEFNNNCALAQRRDLYLVDCAADYGSFSE